MDLRCSFYYRPSKNLEKLYSPDFDCFTILNSDCTITFDSFIETWHHFFLSLILKIVIDLRSNRLLDYVVYPSLSCNLRWVAYFPENHFVTATDGGFLTFMFTSWVLPRLDLPRTLWVCVFASLGKVILYFSCTSAHHMIFRLWLIFIR